MKKSRHLLLSAAIPLLLAPASCMAQTFDDESSFTLHAFVIGFIIIGVIFLIFMGLMLLARVNELSARKKTMLQNKSPDRHEDIMNLNESEIEALLRKRVQKHDNLQFHQTPDKREA